MMRSFLLSDAIRFAQHVLTPVPMLWVSSAFRAQRIQRFWDNEPSGLRVALGGSRPFALGRGCGPVPEPAITNGLNDEFDHPGVEDAATQASEHARPYAAIDRGLEWPVERVVKTRNSVVLVKFRRHRHRLRRFETESAIFRRIGESVQ